MEFNGNQDHILFLQSLSLYEKEFEEPAEAFHNTKRIPWNVLSLESLIL